MIWDNPDDINGIAWTELRLIYYTLLLKSPGLIQLYIFVRGFMRACKERGLKLEKEKCFKQAIAV